VDYRRQKKHERHKELLEWCGGDSGSQHFDIDEVNPRLPSRPRRLLTDRPHRTHTIKETPAEKQKPTTRWRSSFMMSEGPAATAPDCRPSPAPMPPSHAIADTR